MAIQKTQAISGVSPISAKPENPPKNLSNLPAGTSLHAVVAGKFEDNTYLLKLANGQMLRAQSQNELAPGQILNLEVVKSGSVPELKILLSGQTGTSALPVLQNAMRQLLPKQLDLKDFAAALKQLTALATEKTSPAVSESLKALAGSLLSKDDLMTAAGVKQAIQNSGVFLEAKLAQQLIPQGDLKASLLALASALQKEPLAANSNLAHSLALYHSEGPNPDDPLLAKTEAALARIAVDQLAALPQTDDAQHAWQLTLPFTNGGQGEAVKLKIKQEESPHPAQQQANWSVTLELNPPDMGTVNCKISLLNDKVDTYFWCAAEHSLKQVQEHLDLLARRYEDAGLTVGNLDAADGARMSADSHDYETMPSLLDEFA